MDGIFAKSKVNVGDPNENGVVQITIQDESYTVMEPVNAILQCDPRLSFAGYKIKHCLENEIIVRLKCKPEFTGAERACFQDALTTFLSQLTAVEDLCAATIMANATPESI